MKGGWHATKNLYSKNFNRCWARISIAEQSFNCYVDAMFWLLAVGTLKPRSAAGKARNNAKNSRALKAVGRKE